MLKGKILDKLKQFSQSVKEYEKILEILQTRPISAEFEGGVHFRYGWACIKGRMEIQEALEHLLLAHSLMPRNVEVLVKLASVLFKEL